MKDPRYAGWPDWALTVKAALELPRQHRNAISKRWGLIMHLEDEGIIEVAYCPDTLKAVLVVDPTDRSLAPLP